MTNSLRESPIEELQEMFLQLSREDQVAAILEHRALANQVPSLMFFVEEFQREQKEGERIKATIKDLRCKTRSLEIRRDDDARALRVLNRKLQSAIKKQGAKS